MSSDAIKSFILNHVKKGNKICTDGWTGYDYLDDPESGYQRYRHNHGGGDFGFGIESTSHIETLWAHLKAKIKSTYNVMPAKNLYKFIKESEFKYKIRKLDDEHKIKKLFNCYSFLKSIGFTDKDFNDSDEMEDNSDSD